MLAAYHGYLQTAMVLQERGADPRHFDDRGPSPLADAAFKGNAI